MTRISPLEIKGKLDIYTLIIHHIVTDTEVPDRDGCQVAAPGMEIPPPLRVSGHHGVPLSLLLCLRASTGHTTQTFCTLHMYIRHCFYITPTECRLVLEKVPSEGS